ncbi:DMT family transporter [Bacillus badius]|uniref:Permease of the drug/metabolite transporter (DMT) superfamily n=1 Tax=Bacillus badius TaxID=1455 RepID=A0ABR5AVG5_BACBA|nr:EamA family transporter [Bacillus badius]KIL72783.1 Permease of the drug/metabolite transporter (DMT) superfamily [Bacillus badius]KIL78198.1 Permease of the drug/metabolite transporter (DMT) superfamily [Bacillus badius]MED4718313.1 EamA family transporter [Bacillus badius]
MSSKKKVLIADLSLVGISIGWGYSFVLTKDLLNEMTPLYFIGTRFFLAALLLLLFKWKSIKRLPKQVWKYGIFAGTALWGGFVLQTVGIELTTPGKAGVLTGTMVVIVPFLYFFWSKTGIQRGAFLGSLLTFFGLAILSWDGGWTGINTGDVLVFLCAFFFAVHVLLVDRAYQRERSIDSLSFIAVQLFIVGLFSLPFAFWLEPFPSPLSAYGWYAYTFDLLIGTLLAYIVQIKAQQYSPPTHVSLLLSLESVFAFLLSWLLWGETLTVNTVTGIVFILGGIFITEAFDLLRKPKTLSSLKNRSSC